MNILEQIQSKIYELTKEERARLREWFDEFDGDSWDKDLDEYVKNKKLDGEALKAKQNFSDGKFKDL
ncbi:MAG: hypothetical protein WCI84_04565 [Bacteroidota bacterium]